MYGSMIRCLDYEGHEGRCTFPESVVTKQSTGGTFYSYQRPEPWVSPLEKTEP